MICFNVVNCLTQWHIFGKSFYLSLHYWLCPIEPHVLINRSFCLKKIWECSVYLTSSKVKYLKFISLLLLAGIIKILNVLSDILILCFFLYLKLKSLSPKVYNVNLLFKIQSCYNICKWNEIFDLNYKSTNLFFLLSSIQKKVLL